MDPFSIAAILHELEKNGLSYLVNLRLNCSWWLFYYYPKCCKLSMPCLLRGPRTVVGLKPKPPPMLGDMSAGMWIWKARLTWWPLYSEHVLHQAYRQESVQVRTPPWLWNPGQMSPEVQHRGISDPTKRTYVLQNVFKKCLWKCETNCCQILK